MFTLIVILALLLLAVAIAAAFDLIPMWKDWFGRIHIGRMPREPWTEAVTKTAASWLRRTPTIPLTDNNRLIVIDMLRGNYRRASIQHWQEAALLLGAAEYLSRRDDADVRAAVSRYLARTFDADGGWRQAPRHVDAAILAYAVMKLPGIDLDRYKGALDDVRTMIEEHVGEDGTATYRKGMTAYRYVDTVGFICPFLVAYGIRYGHAASVNLALTQLTEYERYGLSTQLGIPCHAYRVDTKAPLGLYGWGRGLGWYAIGLADAWRELSQAHPAKPALTASVVRFAKAASSFQRPDGRWNWTVTRPEAIPDSSATATLSWFMLQASDIPELAEAALESAEAGLRYLMKATRRDGSVDYAQGDTKDIGVYSSRFGILPFAQGFAVRCAHRYEAIRSGTGRKTEEVSRREVPHAG
ncbi:glycoside hydrolase family 88 protein [Paenibacillus aurantiacus]|uniref:Glycoside hydrolase family 88 protein n=1 Tax=Paenibacillus aurantiacus TaxID=1936118 RepID=A0ABV5KIM5_9BACL